MSCRHVTLDCDVFSAEDQQKVELHAVAKADDEAVAKADQTVATSSSDGAVAPQFESTGLFHWCNNRSFESAVLVSSVVCL